MNQKIRPAIGTAVLCLLGVLAACKPPPPAPDSVLIGCDRADDRVEVTQTSHLDPSCTYTAGFDIRTSGVTLDCQGATIRGAQSSGSRGILVATDVDTPLTDVTVRNCRVEGFLNSLRVTRDGFRQLAEGVEYENGLARIVIEDSTFKGSRGVGVFVDGYVEGVTIQRNTIMQTGSSGIYLETGSRRTRVEGNHIQHNGYRENGPGGQPFTFAGQTLWFWGIGREGISIDGSYQNEIIGNVLHHNSAGGIFLYKNCGEYPDRPAYFERRYPSDHNLIEGNVIASETNGIWVGSRMGENTLPMDCTDPAYVNEPLRRVVLDRAAANTIRGNQFIGVHYGIRVEDDHNVVEGNDFSSADPSAHAVIVGTPLRSTVLGRPVDGTVLRGNTASIPGNLHPYRWVTAHLGTISEDNVAHGQPTDLCQGQEPPRLPFVFVIAVAAAGPGGTAPAVTPDLTLPVLGALPDC